MPHRWECHHSCDESDAACPGVRHNLRARTEGAHSHFSGDTPQRSDSGLDPECSQHLTLFVSRIGAWDSAPRRIARISLRVLEASGSCFPSIAEALAIFGAPPCLLSRGGARTGRVAKLASNGENEKDYEKEKDLRAKPGFECREIRGRRGAYRRRRSGRALRPCDP